MILFLFVFYYFITWSTLYYTHKVGVILDLICGWSNVCGFFVCSYLLLCNSLPLPSSSWRPFFLQKDSWDRQHLWPGGPLRLRQCSCPSGLLWALYSRPDGQMWGLHLWTVGQCNSRPVGFICPTWLLFVHSTMGLLSVSLCWKDSPLDVSLVWSQLVGNLNKYASNTNQAWLQRSLPSDFQLLFNVCPLLISWDVILYFTNIRTNWNFYF